MQMTNKQMVLEAAIDLHNQGQVVSRTTLEAVLNIKRISITESISTLEEEGLLDRVVNGLYVPATQHKPPRGIWKRTLPCGSVKLDIGDDLVVLLTPQESRTLAKEMMGEAMQYASIEAGHLATTAINELRREVRDIRKENKNMRAMIEQKPFELTCKDA